MSSSGKDQLGIDSEIANVTSASDDVTDVPTKAAVAVQIKYELENLSMDEMERKTQDETQVLASPPVSDSREEIEMVQAALSDPHVEAGEELLQSLGDIPDKMAFKIGEAADMVGVKQYVLRYWESEFEMLRPRKSKNNQRVYSRRDVETAMMIKKLLYDNRFSIEGARSALRQLKTQVRHDRGVKKMAESQETAVAKLRGLVSEIRRIRDLFL